METITGAILEERGRDGKGRLKQRSEGKEDRERITEISNKLGGWGCTWRRTRQGTDN